MSFQTVNQQDISSRYRTGGVFKSIKAVAETVTTSVDLGEGVADVSSKTKLASLRIEMSADRTLEWNAQDDKVVLSKGAQKIELPQASLSIETKKRFLAFPKTVVSVVAGDRTMTIDSGGDLQVLSNAPGHGYHSAEEVGIFTLRTGHKPSFAMQWQSHQLSSTYPAEVLPDGRLKAPYPERVSQPTSSLVVTPPLPIVLFQENHTI